MPPFRPFRIAAVVMATVALTGSLTLLGATAADAATQTKSCTDGSGVSWTVKATWGKTYTSHGVQKVDLTSAQWTTKAAVVRTDSWVTSYTATGKRVRTLTRSAPFDYRGGTAYQMRNPVNPSTEKGQASLRVTLGVDGDGKGNCSVSFTEPTTVSASDRYEADVLKGTNTERTSRGLKALKAQSCVDRYAEAQAARMAKEQRMYHQDLGPILKECGLRTAGENVAYGYTSGAAVMQGWMNSPGHRANILNSSFQLLGVGAAQNLDGRWYSAQVFGA